MYMRKITAMIDLAAFAVFGTACACLAAAVYGVALCSGRRRRRGGEVRQLSLAVFDLISNKYSSMYDDALLGGYISRHYYIYLDYQHPVDRFENMGGKIFFYSIAVRPARGLYRAGFARMNMLLAEVKALLRACRIAALEGVTFVKAHDPHLLGVNGLLIARLFRMPCILHMNSDFDMKYRGTGKVSTSLFASRGIERIFEKAVIRSYDAIMADRVFYSRSRSFPRSCLGRYRATGVRVDGTHYLEPERRRDLKPGMGLAGRKVALYVGRLHPHKYTEDAIRAFALIKRAVPEAALLVVGTGVLADALARIAREEGISESVHFLGRRNYEDLIDILYTADVLLAPHGGMTLVESALAATPAVAYDFDWHAEFLRDGEMGYLVPFRDHRRMAERAIELLRDDRLRSRMEERCREVSAVQNARGPSMRSEETIYRELIGR